MEEADEVIDDRKITEEMPEDGESQIVMMRRNLNTWNMNWRRKTRRIH